MNDHIATLRAEIAKRDRCIEELERQLFVKDMIIRKQVIMLRREADENGEKPNR